MKKTPDLIDPYGVISSDKRLGPADTPTHISVVSCGSIKSDPSDASIILSEALYGEPVHVLTEKDDWSQIISVIDGYKGWIKSNSIEQIPYRPTHYVSVKSSHLYTEPHLKSPALQTLPASSPLEVTTTEGKFSQVSTGGWVFSGHLNEMGTYQADYMDFALSFLGTPYLWGSRTSEGIDCSGLIQIVLAMTGRRILRDSDLQWQSLGEKLEEFEEPKAGDIAFFPGHVGFMVDGKNILHANATHMAVTIDPLSEVIKLVSTQTNKPPFLGYKRLSGI